jgi:hypothetical protein
VNQILVYIIPIVNTNSALPRCKKCSEMGSNADVSSTKTEVAPLA